MSTDQWINGLPSSEKIKTPQTRERREKTVMIIVERKFIYASWDGSGAERYTSMRSVCTLPHSDLLHALESLQ